MTHLSTAITNLPDLLGFVRIDGCLVERSGTGYMYRGVYYATVDELRKAWREHVVRFANTIKHSR